MTGAHVVVTGYDCYPWFVRCLASVYAQRHRPLHVTVVDDASPDPRMADAVRAVDAFPDWCGIVNTERLGATENIWRAVHAADHLAPDTVTVLVDGDDWLPHADVVEHVVNVYDTDPDAWLVYGSYTTEPDDPTCHPAEPYPPDVIEGAAYRQASCLFNHPLTFRRFLFTALDESDVRLDAGPFVPGIYDEAFMYPLLEMAGPRQRCLPEPLYVYNTANPASVAKAQRAAAAAAGEELRARPPKPRLEVAP